MYYGNRQSSSELPLGGVYRKQERESELRSILLKSTRYNPSQPRARGTDPYRRPLDTKHVMSLPQLKLAHHMTALALERSGLCTLVIRYLGGGTKDSHGSSVVIVFPNCVSYVRNRMRQGNRAGTRSDGIFRAE